SAHCGFARPAGGQTSNPTAAGPRWAPDTWARDRSPAAAAFPIPRPAAAREHSFPRLAHVAHHIQRRHLPVAILQNLSRRFALTQPLFIGLHALVNPANGPPAQLHQLADIRTDMPRIAKPIFATGLG